VPVALGRPTPAEARGWASHSGYALAIEGNGEVSRILRVASLVGLPALKANVEGTAQLQLQIAGSWAESALPTWSVFSAPAVTGNVQLHNVRATMRGVNAQLETASAELQLLPDETRVTKLIAEAADARWTGSLSLPRGCGTPGACLVHFNLNTDSADLAQLSDWLNPPPSERRWYQILGAADSDPSLLKIVRASGKVTAARLRSHEITAQRVSAAIDLDRGKVTISDLRADVLGGKYRGEWDADFAAASPVYRSSGSLNGVSLAELADAMHDPWISGIATASYEITASGADSAAFWQSTEGVLKFDLRNGTLPHIILTADSGPLRITRWQSDARLHNGKIEIEKTRLISPAATYELSGAASLNQALNFKLTRSATATAGGSSLYAITGTVTEPRVVLIPTPETQARLKP